jgi:5'-phosphate synthase pdxT subunit
VHPVIGVLALQGAFAAHERRCAPSAPPPCEVRTPRQLAGVDALVMPGGESTTMSRLLAHLGPVRPAAAAPGRRAAGVRHLRRHDPARHRGARRSTRPAQLRRHRHHGARNGYGRQVDSFEADLQVTGLDAPFHAVFIRAPKVESTGPDVEVLATHDDVPVLCRQGRVLVASFHPELTPDSRLHEMFLHHTVSPSRRKGDSPMSGHSKWATIKHKKGAADKARAKVFAKIARQLEVAAREGGGDPSTNASLRTMSSRRRRPRR